MTKRMRVLEGQPFFYYDLEKGKSNFHFQVSRKRKLKVKHEVSIFIQKKNENLNLISDININFIEIGYFNFRFEQRIFISGSRSFLPVSQRTKTGRQ